MANKRISQLDPADTPLLDSHELPISQEADGPALKVTLGDLKELLKPGSGETVSLPSVTSWRVRFPGGSQASGFGCGVSELKFLDGSANNLCSTVGGTPIYDRLFDASGKFSGAELFNGSTATDDGWYSSEFQSGSYDAWCGINFVSPQTPVQVALAPLKGFPTTFPAFFVVEFQTDKGWMFAGRFDLATGVDDTFQTFTLNTTYLEPYSTAPSNYWNGKGIGFVGDSITANSPDGVMWSDVLCAQLGAYKAAFDAYGGRKVAQATTVIDSLDLSQTDLLFVFCGSNDYGDASTPTPLGTHGDSAATSSFFGNMRDLVETVSTLKPLMRFAFIGPLQRADKTAANSQGSVLADYAAAAKQVCDDYGIPYIDLLHESGFNSITISTLTDDDLHPNSAGMRKLGQRVAAKALGL